MDVYCQPRFGRWRNLVTCGKDRLVSFSCKLERCAVPVADAPWPKPAHLIDRRLL
jgi:hypothetical protein